MCPRPSRSVRTTLKIVSQMHTKQTKIAQAFWTKSNLQIINHIQKQNSNSKRLKILQNPKLASPNLKPVRT